MNLNTDASERTVLLYDSNFEPYKSSDDLGSMKDKTSKNKLGMFMGVVITCVLNTFGVVIFERLGWVTGQAGIVQALLMYLLAYVVVFFTVLSVAAMATNGQMKGGGTYFLVSRVLGPEFGGSIGVVFYIANCSGATFYIIGFGDAFAQTFDMLPQGRWWLFLYCSAALALSVLICFVGAKFYARTSLVILVSLTIAIGLSAVSFLVRSPIPKVGYTGLRWDTLKNNMGSHYEETEGVMYDFRQVFSIVFPSVTGLLSGSNMSGDLKDPAKAIPMGTLLSALITIAVYGGLIVILGASVTREALLDNYFIILYVAYYGKILVAIGIFMAVLSSALGAIIGASRVIQAIARDDLIPFLSPFKQGSKNGDEPRYGLFLTWMLIQITLIFGSLNAIAPFITMFFLLSFLFLNFACFFLRISGAPNFRPSFKYFHWSTALAGAVSSAIVMFYVDAIKASISIILVLLLFFYIHFRAPANQWGDISQALIYHQVRKYLLLLDTRKDHVKFWRPQVLLLVSNPRSSLGLIKFVNNLKKGGLYVLGNVITGSWDEKSPEIADRLSAFQELIKKYKLKAFSEVVISNTIRDGYHSLILTSGLGGMKPNTLIMGWFDPNDIPSFDYSKEEEMTDEEVLSRFPPLRSEPSTFDHHEYVSIIRDTINLRKNVIICKNFNSISSLDFALNDKKYIDLWIFGDRASHNPGPTLSAILLHGIILKRTNFTSKREQIRVLTFVNTEQEVEPEKNLLMEMLSRYRIFAIVEVFCFEDYRPESNKEDINRSTERTNIINEILRTNSQYTRLSFIPLAAPPSSESKYVQYLSELNTLTNGIDIPCLLVYGSATVLTNDL